MNPPKIIGHAAVTIKAARNDRRATKATDGLQTHHFACPTHREPFRAIWPKGWDRWVDVAMRLLLEKAPRFAERANGDIEKIERLLSTTPVCEWLTRDQLMEAYHESGIGYKARCSICSNKRAGTAYVLMGDIVIPFKHVCFGCLVDKKGGIGTHGAVAPE